MVHEYDVEEVASEHHNVNCLFSILSNGGFNACVCVRVCVCVCMCVGVYVCVCVSLHTKMLARIFETIIIGCFIEKGISAGGLLMHRKEGGRIVRKRERKGKVRAKNGREGDKRKKREEEGKGKQQQNQN